MKVCKVTRACLLCVLIFSTIAHGRARSTESDIPKVLSNTRETKHFYFYTNLDRNLLDYYEQVFEGFYSHFNKNYFRIGQKQPLRVFLFKDTESYEPYARKALKRYTRYGFYMGRKKIRSRSCFFISVEAFGFRMTVPSRYLPVFFLR